MTKNRFTEEQVVTILKEAETGKPMLIRSRSTLAATDEDASATGRHTLILEEGSLTSSRVACTSVVRAPCGSTCLRRGFSTRY